jgi:sugar O-acyltransferase (sialic acid O-acetyltransferase NeuD family)
VQRIVVWGATGQAVVLAEFASAAGYTIVALVDNDDGARSPLDGVPLLRGADFETWCAQTSAPLCGALAIGGAHGRARLALADRMRRAGLALPVLVHPAAYVARNATLGEGTQILAGAVVAARAVLGRCCIVNTCASVDHESVLGDGVHVAPGATLAGLVRVDDAAFVGTGASVVPRVRIGRDAVVGAGAVVVRDVAAETTVYGVPARERGSTGSSAK